MLVFRIGQPPTPEDIYEHIKNLKIQEEFSEVLFASNPLRLLGTGRSVSSAAAAIICSNLAQLAKIEDRSSVEHVFEQVVDSEGDAYFWAIQMISTVRQDIEPLQNCILDLLIQRYSPRKYFCVFHTFREEAKALRLILGSN